MGGSREKQGERVQFQAITHTGTWGGKKGPRERER